jgi:hypothetical protein
VARRRASTLCVMKVRVRSEVVFTVGRSAQDLALAALIGGNLFGRVAMHPALTDISDKSERGKVLTRAWRRYGAVNSLALGTLVAGWLPARRNDADARRCSPAERRLVLAKDVAMGAVLVTKGHFPTEDAARKLIYLAIQNAVPQWTRTRCSLPPRRSPLRASPSVPSSSMSITVRSVNMSALSGANRIAGEAHRYGLRGD